MNASDVAGALLGDLAADAPTVEADPTATWGDSGAMCLTGKPLGPPLAPPGDPAGAASALLETWRATSTADVCSPGVGVLGERAAIAGLSRSGTRSCGGAARILPARSGSVVLSLARETDLDLVPVLIGHDPSGDLWDAVHDWLSRTDADSAVEWARTLGLPCAVVPTEPVPAVRGPVTARRGPERCHGARAPRVLDLTSLWAGPLAARLLGLAGADIVKVESRARPDGARRGHPAFFDLLHAGHRAVALDFAAAEDQQVLRRLAESADVVLEASRPRALRHLGLVADELVDQGVTWVSITAYGRDVDEGMRVGFGDDIAVSAGLVARDQGQPLFCGDALADPLAGLTAAAATGTALSTGHAWLVDISMHDVCRVVAGLPSPSRPGDPRPPVAPAPAGSAPALGAHTGEVLAAWLR